jgi:peroxiredoxin Q/BCP
MSDAAGPAEGAPAPAFSMPASGGRTVSSEALKGKPYLLYFYPKADTPGCTTQACGIQEALPQLGKLGLTVIGVSPDKMPPIEKFAKKFNLEFPLASDVDHAVAEAYGVWVEKSMYGKKYMGMERSSFLVDANGTVARVWRKVKPDAHAADVLKAAQALK